MITTLIAVLLDWFFGEPTKYHPLVGFGSLAKYSEKHCYGPPSETAETRRHRGILALLLLLLPLKPNCQPRPLNTQYHRCHNRVHSRKWQ